MAFLIIPLFGFAGSKQVSASEFKSEHRHESILVTDNVLELSQKLFGDKAIDSIEYLYNFDDAQDYIYIDYLDYGYAVFMKESLALLEYSQTGSLPFPETRELRRYYGGPKNYYSKQNEQFIDNITGEAFFVSETEIRRFSNEVRNNLSTIQTEKIDNVQIEKFQNNATYSAQTLSLPQGPKDPGDPTIPDGNGKYIYNYRYFFEIDAIKSYGLNDDDNCVPVATQILLNYNNYYTDRRIIADRHLNGFDDATNSVAIPEQNPNHCANPMSMTEYVLGSRSDKSGTNSYYAHILNFLPSNLPQIKNTLDSVIALRNQQIQSNISFQTVARVPNQAEVIAEINSDRPLIIGMLASLGGLNHATVGYGYQTMNGNVGYIVNYGWRNTHSHRWINSAWSQGFVTMKTSHIHTYAPTGTTYNGGEIFKCTVCGHRKMDFAGGSGTLANPYQITSPQYFQDISLFPNSYFALTNDIDLSTYQSSTGLGHWTPIPEFRGTLDGNGYTIFGMDISTIRQRQMALIGMNYGTISNLHMANVYIHHGVHHTSEWTNAAGIVGENMASGIILNCTVGGYIEINRVSSTVGGIVGWNYGIVDECEFSGTLITNGDTGGIAGTNHSGGIVENSSTINALISHYLSNTARSIGGIVGFNSNATIRNCSVANITIENTGKANSSTGAPPMGIIVGEIRNNSTVQNVSQIGSIIFNPGSLSGNTPTATNGGSGQRTNFGNSIFHHTSKWAWVGSAYGGLNTHNISFLVLESYRGTECLNFLL